MTTARAFLGVDGSIDASTPTGHRVSLRGRGDELSLEASSAGALRALLVSAASRARIAMSARALCAAGLLAHVHVGGKHVASLGRDVSPSLTARLLGLGAVRLRPLAALRMLVGRHDT